VRTRPDIARLIFQYSLGYPPSEKAPQSRGFFFVYPADSPRDGKILQMMLYASEMLRLYLLKIPDGL
jgi:hypothetical protein